MNERTSGRASERASERTSQSDISFILVAAANRLTNQPTNQPNLCHEDTARAKRAAHLVFRTLAKSTDFLSDARNAVL